jgi:Protein of unknown function (DUF3761)
MLVYLRVRSTHRLADDPRLWIGQRGPLNEASVWKIIKHRGEAAGIKGLRSEGWGFDSLRARCLRRDPTSRAHHATAICNDATYSFSQHRQGACSGHGGSPPVPLAETPFGSAGGQFFFA